MSLAASYYAYGRPSDYGGFRSLLAPLPQGVSLDMLQKIAGGFRPRPMGPETSQAQAASPGPFDQAAIVWMGPSCGTSCLVVNRPQKGLSRGGRLVEVVLMDPATGGEILSLRPMRLLSTVASEAAEPAVQATAAKFAARCEAAGASSPLAWLLNPDRRGYSVLSRALARAISAVIRRGSAGHVMVVLPEDQSDACLPLAMAMDEVVPSRRKQHGFAVCTAPASKIDESLWMQLDWTVAAMPADAHLPADVPGLCVCDLRGPSGEDNELAGQIEAFLRLGPDAVEAFAFWLETVLAGAVACLEGDFFQKVVGQAAMERPMMGPNASADDVVGLLDMGIAGSLSLAEFNELVPAAPQDVAQADVRGRLVLGLEQRIRQCPPVVGWLAGQELMASQEWATTVSEAVGQVLRPQATGTKA